MKNILLIITIVVLSSQILSAQKKWFISPEIGMNMTPIKESSEDPSLFRTGLSVGALTGFEFKDHWRLNFGVTFNQRYSSYAYDESSQGSGLLTDIIGSIIGGFDMGGRDYIDVNTEYWTADLPITIDFKFKSGFFFTGGIFANTVISAKNEIETTTHIPILELIDLDDLGLGIVEGLLPKNGTVSESSGSTEGLNSTNFGLVGGIGADAGKVQLKLQYQYGFNDIRSDEFIPGVKKQQVISFHLAYLFFPTASEKSSKLKPRYNLELIK